MLLTTLTLLLAGPAAAPASLAPIPNLAPAPLQRGERSRERGALDVHEVPEAAGIAWFGTWEAARSEAKRTGRPILFMSAAPQCQNVPGVW